MLAKKRALSWGVKEGAGRELFKITRENTGTVADSAGVGLLDRSVVRKLQDCDGYVEGPRGIIGASTIELKTSL
ncbi:MAG: hypothetical protein CL583_05145 [Alteromonadaceae bacterium]|nr:hypothetical protein [Alteromonadaceae bacterium]